MALSFTALVVVLVAVPRAPGGTTVAAAHTAPGPCAAAEHRQFDFFVGDWDAYRVAAPKTVVARNHVTPMVSGCALREVFERSDGYVGESFSTYDAARRVWHQSWVTNRGELLLLNGHMVADSMVLTARDRQADGTYSLLRGVWWREGANVRERADRSLDGHAWRTEFDLVFRPHGK